MHLAVVLTSAVYLASGLASAAGAEDDRVLEREHSSRSFEIEPGAQIVLVVDNLFGGIQVRTHELPRIDLELDKTVRGHTEGHLARALSEVSLQITEQPDLIDLYVHGPFRHPTRREWTHNWRDPGYRVVYDFDLTVPPGVDLRIKTVDGGDMRVSGLRGDFEVINVNGGIEMTGIAGSGTARTVNGPVLVEFDRNPAGDSRFETVNGDVEVLFRPGLAADLELLSTFGELWSEFNVKPLASRPPIETVESGRRVIKTDGGARVRAGSGGPSHSFETLNGDVLIRSRGSDAEMEKTP